MEIRISTSESTLSAYSLSSDSTIPYALDQDQMSTTIDESSDVESVGELWTHHYVTDQAPAPYAESLISESESIQVISEEMDDHSDFSNEEECVRTVRNYYAVNL